MSVSLLIVLLAVQAQLPCGHLFHGSCIDESPTLLLACPVCRRNFDSEKPSRFERLLPDVEFPGDAEFYLVTIPVMPQHLTLDTKSSTEMSVLK